MTDVYLPLFGDYIIVVDPVDSSFLLQDRQNHELLTLTTLPDVGWAENSGCFVFCEVV